MDIVRSTYGYRHKDQFGDLYLPNERRDGCCIVAIHGGFWRPHRTLEMTASLATELASIGWPVWNIEYRRGQEHRPEDTLADSASALDHVVELAQTYDLDPARVIVLGHSAGGHLAAWCAGRCLRESGAPRALAVRPIGVITLGAVLNLSTAALSGIGDDAVREFLGGLPEEKAAEWRAADPSQRLPTGVRFRCLHSPNDERVPIAQAREFVQSALLAGDDAELIEVPGGHEDPICISSQAWQTVLATVASLART